MSIKTIGVTDPAWTQLRILAVIHGTTMKRVLAGLIQREYEATQQRWNLPELPRIADGETMEAAAGDME